jgi:hypothetical protein
MDNQKGKHRQHKERIITGNFPVGSSVIILSGFGKRYEIIPLFMVAR